MANSNSTTNNKFSKTVESSKTILLKNQFCRNEFDANFKNVAFNKPGFISDSFDHQKISIHKFGGSSLANKDRLFNVTSIIKENIDKEDFIVVSANSKITDWLIDFSNGNANTLNIIKKFYDCLIVETLIEPGKLLIQISQDIEHLRHQHHSTAEILAYGEVWSANLLVALLNEKGLPALFVDSRDLLKCRSINDHTDFDIDYFFKGIEKNIYGNFGKRLIITGYIASNLQGDTVTLGRNGSDYTASLLAYLSEAQSVTLWTDVKGIYTADPALIKQAKPIAYLSYNEAKALAATGTNVLHSKSITPLLKNKTPLFIRSSLTPKTSGTCISEVIIPECEDSGFQVTSVALKENLFKVTISFNNETELTNLTEQLLDNHFSILQLQQAKEKKKIVLLMSEEKIAQSKLVFSDLKLTYAIEIEPRSAISIIGNKIIEQSSIFESLETNLSHQFQYRIIDSYSDNLILLVSQDKQAKELFQSVYNLLVNTQLSQNHLTVDNQDSSLSLSEKITTQFNNVTNLTLKKAL